MDIPKVSISVITYNHARFVRQALDGILMQEVNFPYEVIVGDDVSPDNTREILQEYAARFPDRIRLILHEQKGAGIPGKLNFVSTIHAARGEYVAMLDGDDYWTDPLKLQRQVDFLDSHPDFSLCFHNSRLVFEGVEGFDRNYNPEITEVSYTAKDLILRDWFIHSGSMMYRRNLFPEVFPEFYDLPSGDIPIGIFLASKGNVRYLPQVMSVYRKNAQSVSSQLIDHQGASAFRTRIKVLEVMDKVLAGAYRPFIQKTVSRYHLEAAKQLMKAGDKAGLEAALADIEQRKADLSLSEVRMFHFLKLGKNIPGARALLLKVLPWIRRWRGIPA